MLYLIFSCLFFSARTLTNKEYTKDFSGTPSNMLFNAIGLSVTCIISILLGGVQVPSTRLLIIAAIFGLMFAGTVYFMLICYAKGPLGLVALIFNLCCVVPTMTGFILFKEPFSWMKLVGLLMFLGVVILSWQDGEAKDQGEKVYIPAKIWMPVTILTMLMNGSLSTMQNMAVHWCADESINTFNFWAYLIGGSALWIATFVCKLKKGDFSPVIEKKRRFFSLALICGLLASGGNIIIMYALKVLPASLAYPLQSSIITLSLYLIGLFWYKEARTRLGIPMVVLGILSIVFLSMA
ncbi:MAG: hypothetical protein HUJ69_07620 [Lachnospiraceae bacterium]|nr:hypothetical protein [Lachnospiraceae bacterium]